MRKDGRVHSNEGPKVCIIIPVYNAEKWLGYCLNSVLSQTYANWKAILVDDGSTDQSLAICKNYESIDARFQTISKPNGGVSSARNTGVQHAEGDYLEFLDSDDCLPPDALEKQVARAIQYRSPLVITNATVLDFEDPEGQRMQFTSNWLGEPCVCLSAQEFREKRMRLIWFTVLLESIWSKLYDLRLWRELGLMFPEELSLGEDFVTNMRYFEAVSSVVFLNECGYYYNQRTGSGSLTDKFRPDLFETKMFLMKALEDHLGGRKNLQRPELDAFYDYVASNGWHCVEKIALASAPDETQRIEILREMFAHRLFAESVFHAEYTPERFRECIHMAKKRQYREIIRHLSGALPHDEAQQPAEAAPELPALQEEGLMVSVQPECRSGKLNRAIRKAMRAVRPALGNGKVGNAVTRLEAEIEEVGLKNTFNAHFKGKPTKTQRLIAMSERIQHVEQCMSERISQAQDELATQIKAARQEIEKRQEDMLKKTQACDVRTELGYIQDDLVARIDAARREIEARQEGLQERLGARDLTAELTRIQDELAARIDAAMQEIEARQEDLQQRLDACDLSCELQQIREKTEERINQASAELEARLKAAQEDIKGHVWLSEQRVIRHAYLSEINELRQKKKALMLATAEHANIGDAAITLAEQQLLGKIFPEYEQVEISTYEFKQKEEYLHAILNAEDMIVINGGGNIGDIYQEEEELHRKIISEFPDHKIVIFPQTIVFTPTESGAAALLKSATIYNRHQDLTLFVRGEVSLAFAKEHFPRVKSFLMPDTVHVLRSSYAFDRSGALLCLRDDKEGMLQDAAIDRIVHTAMIMAGDVERRTNMHREDIGRDSRGFVVRSEIMRFARHRVVITDRLHGMIFSAITGTPCVVLSLNNHKISEYYNAFFRDSNAVFYIGHDLDRLVGAIAEAMRVTQPHYAVFEKDWFGEIPSLLREKAPDEALN